MAGHMHLIQKGNIAHLAEPVEWQQSYSLLYQAYNLLAVAAALVKL